MQAITTRFIGQTSYKPARIQARSASGLKVTLSWDHGVDQKANHIRAARALAEKYDWPGAYVMGGLNDKGEYVFVALMRGASLQGSDGFVL